MITDKERDCINESRKIKLAEAKTRLAAIEKDCTFDNPIGGFDGITWEKDIKKRILQIMALPVVPFLLLVLLILTPFAYVSHIRNLNKEKRIILDEIKNFETEHYFFESPSERTIESLWKLHGIGPRECSSDDRMTLLCKWVSILYGKEASEKIDLESRREVIAQRHLKINEIFQADGSSMHIDFMPPEFTLIAQLSNELPPYYYGTDKARHLTLVPPEEQNNII